MKRKFPDTLIIILGILLIFIILTWIIPSGEFDRVEQAGRTVVQPGTFHEVDPAPQGVGAFFMAPIKGFIDASQIIAFVFLVGGAFGVVTKTGAIDAGLQRILVYGQRHSGLKKAIIPIVMVLFSLGGATFGMAEETMVFILITIPLSIALGYDSIVGVSLAYVGALLGFAGAFINPFTVGVAQSIAELPPTSGIGYRLIVWTIMTLVGILFVMRYARKIYTKPESSLMYEIDKARTDTVWDDSTAMTFKMSHRLVLLALLASLAILVYGVSGPWKWYINEISALFVALGVVAAFVARMSPNTAADAFWQGAKDMILAAIIIGFARGLIIVVEEGKVIDTMLNALASISSDYKWINVQLMFFFQSILNFFVPSGSGQAALTMPLMTPLSDLLGISRQTAVLAYQLGDGISNIIIPTNGVLMGVIGLAKIPYNVWFRFILPLTIILTLLGMLLLMVAILFPVW